MIRALASIAKAVDWTPMPAPRTVLRRQSVFGPDANGSGMIGRYGGNALPSLFCRVNHRVDADVSAQRLAAGQRDDSRPQSIGGRRGVPFEDFSRVPARAPNGVAEFSDDASDPSSTEGNAASAAVSKTGAAEDTAVDIGETATPLQGNVNGKVTSLDLITGSSGAVTGFPAVTGGGSLDSPGPFNDSTTGACRNIHQMSFTVTGIPSSELRLLRMIDRKSTTAGTKSAHQGNDGPSPATVLRPTPSQVVVADATGYKASGLSSDFPITYDADFKLYAFDLVSQTILAELDYTVTIAKSTLSDAKPTNQISVTKKVLK
jgi:hypothetical protein